MNGQYQNYINELPSLELYRYENIFKVYQTGDKNFYFYNIIKKLAIPDDINSDIFSTVTLKNNIPLTVLSYNLYGTTYLWWLICAVNKIQNPFDPNLSGRSIKVIKKQYIKTVLDSINTQLQ
jgi:hypothetical protein